MSSELEGIRTSNLVYGWSTMTRIECAVTCKLKAQGGAVQLTSCIGRRHSVAAALQVSQLVRGYF